MAITKEKKSEIYKEYMDVLKGAVGLVVTEYRGMDMKGLNTIRKALRPVGGQYSVVKTTIFRIALRENGFADPKDLFSGPVAIAIAKTDMAKMTKALLGIKDVPLMVLKGAVIGHSVFKADQLEAVSTMPTLEEARATLIGTIQSPATQFLSLINQPGQQLAQVLKAFTDKMQGGEAA
jgi:large subunit ribosomal protein L10